MKRSIALTVAALLSLAFAVSIRNEAGAAPADGATHLIIVFHVAEDRLQDFLPIMTGINEGMASEEGFQSAVVYRDADNPLSFTLIETWESRALHEAHYDRIVASGDWENIKGMLTETPVLRYNEKL
jgi:quinol monooxygenase YgiN